MAEDQDVIRAAFNAGFWEGAEQTSECCGCSGPGPDAADDAFEKWDASQGTRPAAE